MKYLGLDYGAKRIGIALSDEGGAIAFPRETIANMRGALTAIQRLIEEEKVDCVVVGDTKSYGGLSNPITSQAKSFVEEMKEKLNVPVVLSWEAGSSIEANRYDPERVHNDSSAAAIILQRFLDSRKNT